MSSSQVDKCCLCFREKKVDLWSVIKETRYEIFSSRHASSSNVTVTSQAGAWSQEFKASEPKGFNFLDIYSTTIVVKSIVSTNGCSVWPTGGAGPPGASRAIWICRSSRGVVHQRWKGEGLHTQITLTLDSVCTTDVCFSNLMSTELCSREIKCEITLNM